MEKYYHKKNSDSVFNVYAQKQECPFELEENSIWKQTQDIRSLSKETLRCPKCRQPLINDNTLIPIGDNKNVKIPGRLCNICKILYVSNGREVEKVLRDNRYSKGFTLNGLELWDATKKEKERKTDRLRQEKLSSIYGSVVLICVKYEDQSLEEYIITNNKKIPNRKGIFHYSSPYGLELISAAFAEKRSGKGVLQGRAFDVLEIKFANKNAEEQLGILRPDEIQIQKDGGYSSSIKNKRYEIVDLLLYSPFHDRYEILKATFDRDERYCFSDIGIYRDFVHKYGNPGVKLLCNSGFRGWTRFEEFREESLLKEWGYSVSVADDLSTYERQEILKEIIDLNICEVSDIIRHLNFCCRVHSSEKYNRARILWNEDIEFVKKYKANPERFLIAQTNK